MRKPLVSVSFFLFFLLTYSPFVLNIGEMFWAWGCVVNTRIELSASKLIELHVRQKLSLAKIGKMYGITRQRVHQLKKEYEKSVGKIHRHSFVDVLTLRDYLDKGYTVKDIAEELELTTSKVSRLIRQHQEAYELGMSNINIKRKSKKDLINKALLYELYVHQLWTDEDVAKKYNISASTVNILRKEYGIATNNNKSLRKLPTLLSASKFHQLYKVEGYTLQEIADTYKCNVMAIIRLKEKYQISK